MSFFGARIRLISLAAFSLLFVGGGTVEKQLEPTDHAAKAWTPSKVSAAEALAKQPLRFEENVGQPGAIGSAIAHARGAAIAFDEEGAHMAFRSPNAGTTALSMSVDGGRAVKPVVSDELPTKINYLQGKDPAAWRKNVATYGKLTYPSVLDGVDLVFHGEAGQFEYDFVVAPGTDASKVAMKISGGEQLSLTDSGDLAIETAHGTLIQQRPRVYQHDESGAAHEVNASYRLAGEGKIAFNVDAYDHTKALVIDPVLAYSTFLGGADNDQVSGMAIDNGHAYLVGSTNGDNISFWSEQPQTYIRYVAPAIAGVINYGTDAFVARVDSNGSVGFVTFFGGMGTDNGTGIAVDTSHRVYVTGSTTSFDMFVSSNAMQPQLDAPFQAGQDAFLFTLDGEGATAGTQATYSTYVDIGTNTQPATCVAVVAANIGCTFTYEFTDTAHAIATDGAGNVFLGGDTIFHQSGGSGADPSTDSTGNGAWVASLTAPAAGANSPTGALLHKGLLGGGYGATVNSLAAGGGQLWAGGRSCDATFVGTTVDGYSNPVGTCDGTLMRFSGSTLALGYGTWIGSQNDDGIRAIALGGDGAVYATGFTNAGVVVTAVTCTGTCAFPVTTGSGAANGAQDAFVLKFDLSGGTGAGKGLAYSRLLGGSGYDVGTAIAVDPLGHAFVAGYTTSNDFVGMTRATTDQDAFALEIAAAPTADVLNPTYFGGAISADEATGIAVATDGIYLAGSTVVNTQVPMTDDFPTTNSAQPGRGGSWDGFIAKLSIVPLTISPSTATVETGQQINFSATGGVGPYVFSFAANNSFGTLDANTGVYVAGPGTATDIVRVVDAAGTPVTATITVVPAQNSSSGGSSTSGGTSGGVVTPLTLTPAVASTTPLGTLHFTAGGGQLPYHFDLVTNASNGRVQSDGTYVAGTRGSVVDRIRVTDAVGQSQTASINVGPAITISPASPHVAQGGVIHFSATGGTGVYTWSATGGAIVASTGAFTAPSADAPVTVTAKDTLGNVASVVVAVGAAVGIDPSTPSTFPKGTVQFTAFAGAGGFNFAIIDNKSGGTIDAASGLYTAGPTGNVVDTVDVRDANNRHAQATVTVGPSLTITPSSGTPVGNTQIQFNAAGGSGTGYVFSIQSSQSGASINGQTGLYTAGPKSGTDIVKLVDSVGNEATATLQVSASSTSNGNGASSGNGSNTGVGSNTGTTSSGGHVVGVGGSNGDSGGCNSTGGSTPSYEWLVGLGVAIIATRRRRAARLDS